MDDVTRMLDSLSSSLSAHPTLLDSVTVLLAAFVFSQVLAWAYERTFRGLSYSADLTHTIILSAVSASLVVLAMKHSIVAGLGLLAALSMIRFRVTLRTSKDLVYIMSAMALGIACGANALVPAAAGCAAFVLVSLYLYVSPFGLRNKYDGVLRFRTETSRKLEPDLTDLLGSYCRRFVLLNVGEIAQGTRLEHAYQVKLRRDGDREALLAGLRERLSASDARLLMQETATEF